VSETLAGQASRIDALHAGLADRGYVEGRSIVIEVRSAESDYDRLPRLATELANSKVEGHRGLRHQGTGRGEPRHLDDPDRDSRDEQ